MSKRRKHQSWGAIPLMGAIPTGEIKIKNPNYEDPKALKARLKREEAEEKAAPVNAAIEQLSKTMLDLRAAKADALFKIPSEDLSAAAIAAPENIPGTVEEIRGEIKTALDSALAELEREGVTLHDSGKRKMQAVSRLNLTVDWRLAANWKTLYDVMVVLAVFADEDATVPQPIIEPPAEPTPSVTDIETMDTETTAGRRRAIALVTSLASSEFAPLAQEWVRHLGTTHGIYPTESEMKKIAELFRLNNWYWGDRRNYDRARKYMILVEKAWPLSALSDIERLELEIENSDINNYDTRRELTHKIKQPRA